MHFCPSCNVEIDEKFKFCPNCGSSLEEVQQEQVTAGSNIKQVICNACGEENEVDARFCVSCGANLAGAKTEIRQTPKSSPKPVIKISAPNQENKDVSYNRKKQNEKNKNSKREQAVKQVPQKNTSEFDTKKIAIVFAGILLFALVILYFAGVFDEPKVATENFPATNQAPGSGIDLASIDKINQLDAQLKSEPNNFDLVLQLAHLRNDSGFKTEAITLYKKYLEKFPNNADVLVDMGVCYFDLQQYDDAIPLMEKAVNVNPKHQIAHMNLGIVNLAKGNIEKSKEWLQKAVNLDPNSEIGRKAKELLTSH